MKLCTIFSGICFILSTLGPPCGPLANTAWIDQCGRSCHYLGDMMSIRETSGVKKELRIILVPVLDGTVRVLVACLSFVPRSLVKEKKIEGLDLCNSGRNSTLAQLTL